MRISRPSALRHPLVRRTLEAIVLAIPSAFAPEYFRVRDGSGIEPHPGWIAVLILAARDGTSGLFAGLLAAAVAIGAAAALAGGSAWSAWGRLDSTPELLAFGAAIAVSWVASWHQRRQAMLEERLRARRQEAMEADETIRVLRGAIVTLRARVDRTSSSLSFLRAIAARLEGRDPVAAAEGAADLALARTGATAAAVELGFAGGSRCIALRDAREPRPHDQLALADADLSVPIRDGKRVFGFIALWGIPPPGVDEATAHDLAIVAAWCAPALDRVVRREREAKVVAGANA